MSDDKPFTAEQVELVMRSAGYDPAKPLTDQVASQDRVTAAQVRSWIEEAFQEREQADQQASQQRQPDQAQGQRMIDRMKAERVGPFSWDSPSGSEPDGA